MLHCGTSVPFIYTHVDKYPICQKRNTLITKFLTYRCKSNKMLVLDLILPFYPNLHKILMSRVMNHAEKDLCKILEPYLRFNQKRCFLCFLKCPHLMQNLTYDCVHKPLCGTLIINLGKNLICACYCKQIKTSFARIK